MANEQAATIKVPEEEKQVDQPASSAEPQLAAEEEAKVEVQVRNNENQQSEDGWHGVFPLTLQIIIGIFLTTCIFLDELE